MTVVIEIGEKVQVSSPYHAGFVGEAKRLGAKWNPSAKTWNFDLRDEQAARKLCQKHYGTDGSPETAKTGTIQIRINQDIWGAEVWFGNFRAAVQFSKKSSTSIAPGVVILKGDFHGGGSAKHPAATPAPGTILELRDLPLLIIEGILKEEREQNPCHDGKKAWEVIDSDKEAKLDFELEKLIAAVSALDGARKMEFIKRLRLMSPVMPMSADKVEPIQGIVTKTAPVAPKSIDSDEEFSANWAALLEDEQVEQNNLSIIDREQEAIEKEFAGIFGTGGGNEFHG